MSLETVPLEPFEARGILAVQWNGDLFAVSTQREGGMPAMAVRDGATLYTSQTGLGWTTWDLARYTQEQGRGFRYLAWDVRQLLEDATLVRQSAGSFEAESSYVVRGEVVPAVLTVTHDGSRVQQIVVATPADAESPYTLRPQGQGLGFPVAVPGQALPADEVMSKDGAARDSHARILGWIDQYRQFPANLNRLPDQPSADSLALQRGNTPWPTSPYDGLAMGNQLKSGHFVWTKCSDTDATYQGLGWDTAPLSRTFGRGCTGNPSMSPLGVREAFSMVP